MSTHNQGLKVPVCNSTKEVKHLKRQLGNLQGRYSDACDELLSTLEEIRRLDKELRYLNDFIHWRNLEQEFRWFQHEAHEETNPDSPFPRLVMDTENQE